MKTWKQRTDQKTYILPPKQEDNRYQHRNNETDVFNRPSNANTIGTKKFQNILKYRSDPFGNISDLVNINCL